MTESQPTPLVVTFTANPSIDRTIALDAELRRGEVQRAVSITEQAAGKGINVARVVAASGYQVSAVCAGLDEQYSMLAARSAEPPRQSKKKRSNGIRLSARNCHVAVASC